MAHVRSALRAVVRPALVTTLAGFRDLPAWSASIDSGSLPAFAIATPLTQTSRVAADTWQRAITLLVMAKRTGGDVIEDTLDADALAIEAAMGPVFDAFGAQWWELETEATRLDGDGADRIGSIDMTFRVAVHTAAGSSEL